MLTRVRIEVEETTPELCVEVLNRYEAQIQRTEAERYGLGYTKDDFKSHTPFSAPTESRNFYNEVLGRDIVEEVIEYDASTPCYKGRRVVRFRRLDTRHGSWIEDDV